MLVTSQATPHDEDLAEQNYLRPDDVVIALMGMTGSGKSTFVKYVTGQDVEIGHRLEPCTQDTQVFVTDHPDGDGRRLVLVDTQGFDDDLITDGEVLQRIAGWMGTTYKNGLKLSGLLFFHKISDNRVGGTAMKNLRMFKKLVGEESLKNVVLVTTMWGLVEEGRGAEREQDLIGTGRYWGDMIKYGAQHARFHATPDSGREVLELLRDHPPMATQLQIELVDNNLPISETAAGIAVDNGLERSLREHRETIAGLEEEKKKAMEQGNLAKVAEIIKDIVRYEAMVRKSERLKEALKERRWWEAVIIGGSLAGSAAWAGFVLLPK